MCRLAAFPPGTISELAWEIMQQMKGNHKDGTGSVYLKKGKFVVNKWPYPLDKVWKHNYPLFEHMPCDSWTLAHIRTKTIGDVSLKNTHPFVIGQWATVHNGTWTEARLARTLLRDELKLTGESDSEVAAACISKLGPVDFYNAIDWGSGVFLVLNKNGTLKAMNTGGDLERQADTKTPIIASDLRLPMEYEKLGSGVYRYNKDGTHELDEGKIVSVVRVPKQHHQVQAKQTSLFDHDSYTSDKGRGDISMLADGSIISACKHNVLPKSMCGVCNPVVLCEHQFAKGHCVWATCKGDKRDKFPRNVCSHGNDEDNCMSCIDNISYFGMKDAVDIPKMEVPKKSKNVLKPDFTELNRYLTMGGY